MRTGGVHVKLLTSQPEVGGDELRCDALGHQSAVAHRGRRTEDVLAHAGRSHWHPAHDLEATDHSDVVRPGDDRLCAEIDRLLTRPTASVDGDAWDVLRQARGKPGPPARRGRLFPRLV